PRIFRFAATAGMGGTKAPACSVVVLDWVVDQLPCFANRQLVSMRLLRDGQPIARPFLLTDSFPDATEVTASYTLEVTARDASGAVCSTVTQTLTVERLAKAVALQIPPELTPGTPGEGM